VLRPPEAFAQLSWGLRCKPCNCNNNYSRHAEFKSGSTPQSAITRQSPPTQSDEVKRTYKCSFFCRKRELRGKSQLKVRSVCVCRGGFSYRRYRRPPRAPFRGGRKKMRPAKKCPPLYLQPIFWHLKKKSNIRVKWAKNRTRKGQCQPSTGQKTKKTLFAGDEGVNVHRWSGGRGRR